MTEDEPYRPAPLVRASRHSGWSELALYRRREPRRYTASEYDRLSTSERRNWNLERADWHSNLPFVHTTQADELLSAMSDLVDGSHETVEHAKPALLLDGRAGYGKSATLRHFLYEFHRKQVAQRGPKRSRGHRPIDVIAISARATTNERGLAIRMRDFLELPPVGKTERDITNHVMDAIFACNVRVIAIDELHFMGGTAAAGRRMSNYIKDLINDTPCTFLFAGNDVLSSEIFRADRGRPDASGEQLLSLMDRRAMAPFLIGNQDDVWLRALISIESNLRLTRLQEGDVFYRCADILWAKTGGLWRGLKTVVNRACSAAIKTETERITPDILRAIPADALNEASAQQLLATMGNWSSLPPVG